MQGYLTEYNKKMKTEHKILITGVFLIPLKLSFTYIALLPLIIYFLIKQRQYLLNELKNNPFIKYCTIFFILVILSGFFGFQDLTGRSVFHSSRLIFTALLIPLTSYCLSTGANLTYLIIALGLGQSIASIHSIYQYINPLDQKQIFIGTVTESGQLALTIPLLFGLIFQNKSKKEIIPYLIIPSILGIFICTNLGLTLPAYFCLAFSGVILIYSLVKSLSWTPFISLVICSTALFVNLKRGPLLAVFIVCLFFSSRYYPIASILIGAIISIAFYSFEPLRDRLLSTYDHFTIAGGREEIWQLGLNYLKKYPLGIGFDNSRIISKYSQSIPSELKHFHNNYLNIGVELGITTLVFFLVIMFYLLSRLLKEKDILSLSIFACISSLMLAGIVEYNLGDSEILLLFFVILGISNFILIKKKHEEI